MASPLFSASYIIFNLNEKGLPVGIIPHYTNKGTYISAAITLCLSWTKTPDGRQPFINLARAFLPQWMVSWRSHLTDEEVVYIFFDKIYASFPYMMDNKQWKNEDFFSCHYRRICDRDGRNFDTRNQAIVINGVRTERMCRAGVRAVTSGDPNSKDSKRFQTFMFSLAKSFYHELGHMFVTFLGGGVVNTPPHIMVYRSGEPLRAIGEAGRFVEDLLLGGLTNIFKDKEDDDDQAGRLYLSNRLGTREITQPTIKKLVGFEFLFPLSEAELGGPPSLDATTIGAGEDVPEELGDPMNMFAVPGILESYHANPAIWDKAVSNVLKENPNAAEMTAQMQSILRQVPLNPALLLAEKPKGVAGAAA